ncbi:MAG: OmpW/AlkL family protein [Rubrivivax sp.]|jgi:outer membrane protein
MNKTASPNVRLGMVVLGIAALSGAALPALAQQEKGDWLVRARALHLDSANKDSTGLGLTVNNKTFLEVDITRFLSPNLAVELVLALPQKHTLKSNGSEIGSLKHLPPTLSLQYHATGLGGFRPYVGAGLNYTRFMDVEFVPALAALNPSIKKNSYGLSFQVGADVLLGGGWVLNVDVKKVQIATEVTAGGSKLGKFKVDPVLFSVGAGMRF